MTLSIDHSSPTPLHAQVETLLRKLVEEPSYRDGRLLPKEADLARRLGVSRNTIRQAMTKLVHEGLIVRKRSVGSVVAGRTDNRNNGLSFISFPETLHKVERAWTNVSVETRWVASDKATSEALDIAHRTRILRLERLKRNDKGPVVLFVSWFHPRLGLDENCDFEKPLYELLDRDFSIVPAKSCEDISAIAADRKTARMLGLPFGAPVLKRERLVLDPGGRPIERNICYYRCDRYVFSIDIVLTQEGNSRK